MRRAAPLVLAAVAAAPLLVSACTGSCACPSIGGGASDAGPFEPPSYSSTDVASALTQCDLPHGPVVSPATYGEKRAFMLGAWIECPPPADTIFHPAIAFRSDGAWRRLVSDGSGGLQPGTGADDSGMYDFRLGDNHPTNGDPFVTVSAGPGSVSPTSYSEGPLTLEMSPSRLYVIFRNIDTGTTIYVWLVRLPGA